MRMGPQVKWRLGQMDLYRNARPQLAKAYREAASTALVDPHFTPAEQRARHDHYISKAKELEASS